MTASTCTPADETQSVAVFCGSSLGHHKAFSAAALSLGRALAHAGRPLVWGSGSQGIMGIVSGSVMLNGGRVIGVVPEAMVNAKSEVSQPDGLLEDADEITQSLQIDRRDKIHMVIVNSVSEQKIEMGRRVSAFIALPGGIGTFEEILDSLTLAQVGFHSKPIIVVNVLSYFDPLREMIKRGIKLGFIHHENEHLVRFVDGPEDPEAQVDFDWGKATLEAIDCWKTCSRMGLYDWNKTVSKAD